MTDDPNQKPPNPMTVADLEAKKQERLKANFAMNDRLRSTRGISIDEKGNVIPPQGAEAPPPPSPFADISTETLKDDLIRLTEAGLGKGDAAKAIDQELRIRFGRTAGGMGGGQRGREGANKPVDMNDEIRRAAGRTVDSY